MRGVKAAANGTSPIAWDVVNEATNDTAFFKPNRYRRMDEVALSRCL